MYKATIAIPAVSLLFLVLVTSTTLVTFSFGGTSYAQFDDDDDDQGAEGAVSNDTTITTGNNTNIGSSSRENLDAAQIYETNDITVVDPSIRNLAIIIPDNIAGSSGSAPSWPTFLPASATIAEGMRVVWFNADVNATHSLVVKNSTGGLLNSTSIPYLNATVYRFGEVGQHTFSDPSLPRKNGTINVIEPTTFNESSFTNSSGTVGLFIVPATGKPDFDPAINKLGFNQVSTFNFRAFPGGVNNSGAGQSPDNFVDGTQRVNGTFDTMILYVWTQETSGIHTTVMRIASKVRLLEDILYPDGMVKPS